MVFLQLHFPFRFFFSMIVDYGFIITGVNKLSKIENDSKVSCIINNIIYTKIFIFLLMLPLFLVGYYFTITKNLEWDVFLFSLCIPLSSIVNLSWALRGLHQIKAWSILTIVGQIFYISLIFVFINEPSDVYKINLFYGFGVLLTGFLSIVFLKKKIFIKIFYFTNHSYKKIQSIFYYCLFFYTLFFKSF